MPTTKTLLVYTFGELDDKAKERARDWWRSVDLGELVDSVTNDDWFAETYKEAGYTFTEAYWDIERGSHYSPQNMSADILACLKAVGIEDKFDLCSYLNLEKHHYRCGESKYKWEIHYSAPESKKRITAFLQHACEALNNQLEELEHKALKAIREQNDWLNSKEYIDDMLVANEYEFLENGRRA